MKKAECSRRSVRKNDEYVIDYACEDACVKAANVKSVKKCSFGGRSQACAHKNTLRVPIYCAGQVRDVY